MFESICTLPLPSELFAQSVHPTSSLIAFGFASGRVQIDRLPASDGTENGQRCIDTVWKTRRHRGSCRCLAFTRDGHYLFSAGSDGLLKCADTENGRVASKIALPQHEYITLNLFSLLTSPSSLANGSNYQRSKPDSPTLILSPTPQHLCVATDSSALYIYDLRSPSITTRPSQKHKPHVDYVSSLTPLPPSPTSTSNLPRQFLTTGDTTIAITDLRKGVVLGSEDMGEELLCAALVGNKTVVGSERGVLRIWETGRWEEPPESVRVRGEGIEAVCAVPDTLKAGEARDTVVCGMGDGAISILRLGKGKRRVIGEVSHDQIDAPGSLGFLGGDEGRRMVSGGGRVVKIWEEEPHSIDKGVSPDRDDGESLDESGIENDDEGESSDEVKTQRKRKKKTKMAKGKGKHGNHGVIAFHGMD